MDTKERGEKDKKIIILDIITMVEISDKFLLYEHDNV